MNRIYRLVFNRQLGVMQVASELASFTSAAQGAASFSSKGMSRAALSVALVAILGLASASSVQAQSRYYFTQDGTVSTPLLLDERDAYVGPNAGDDVTVLVKDQGSIDVTTDQIGYTGHFYIGWFNNTKAKVVVDGPNASIYTEKEITIGNSDAQGTLIVQNGGLVQTGDHPPSSSSTTQSYVVVGLNGQLIVENPGSRLITGVVTAGDRNVYGTPGEDLNGFLIARDGATLVSRYANLYSHGLDDTAAATVTGAGTTWTIENQLWGGGLDLLDGAKMSVGSATITSDARTTANYDIHEPQVLISGQDTSLTSAGNVNVEWGTVTLADGGRLELGANEIRLSSRSTLFKSDSAGALTIGGRTKWEDSSFPDIGEVSAATAAGYVNPEAKIRFMDSDLLNNSGLIFNHTETDYVFSNTLISDRTGDGKIFNLAGHTTLTGDLTAFSGHFGVSGGTLVLDDSVSMATGASSNSTNTPAFIVENGGAFVVDGSIKTRLGIVTSHYGVVTGISDDGTNSAPGGILGGSGLIDTKSTSGAAGAVYVYDGGTIAPGHDGVGTLTIDGGLALGFATSGLYGKSDTLDPAHLDIDIKADGTSDKLVVTGATQIGSAATSTLPALTADVRVTALDDATSYQDGQQYTILTSTGGITGQFTGVTSQSAFLRPTLTYDANNVFLNLALSIQDIGNGQVLAGVQDQGTTRILSGGTLSPGTAESPIGTMQFNGDLTFAAGAFYDVDIKGATTTTASASGTTFKAAAVSSVNDLVNVSGKATLDGGTVRVTALDPQASYQDGHVYSILHADGGVSGTFAGSASRSAFLTTDLSYTANDVLLGIKLVTAGSGESGGDDDDNSTPGTDLPPPIFETVANSRNQYNIAQALDTLPQQGEALALYNQLLMQDADSARAAFGDLSGEVHTATRSALLDDRFLQDGVRQRLAGQAVGMDDNGLGVWVAGSGATGHLDGDQNAARTEGQRQGLMGGVDWTLGEDTVIGVVAGNEDLQQRVPQWQSTADIDANAAGVYAATHWGALSLRGGVNYADYDVDTRRQVVVGATVDQAINASYKAHATTFYAEGGWDFVWDTLSLTPYLAVAHTRLETDGTTEVGGSTALVVADSKDELLTSTAGVRAAWDISGGQSDGAVLTAGLAWQNASGELKADSRARFAAGGDSFTVYGTPLARNVAIAELGVGVNTGTRSRLSLSAQGRAGDGLREFGAQLNWAWKF
ncbi:T5SS/PEP-CTERM-associated repeat-containing protein [Pseudoxanthomonas sp. GM95]|uniref:autotransporter domain-containing protein n=1 Tax=Pseudoxanthomonas sp. GM95 TaxID=1881043 RepID=UPI0008C1E001|nr:autotransporter domain-containing protein [Pseudoxanthomonas sp. GM95]SEK48308.1 T5SS/PEP-CTERM-associated repeat-containing protein [Pseudoxanthomonas sp. GM95]